MGARDQPRAAGGGPLRGAQRAGGAADGARPERAAADPATLSDAAVRVLDPDAPDFAADVAARRAVAAVGFAAAGTAPGEAGPAERDAALTELELAALDEERARIADGRRISALAGTPAEGALASGMAMRVDDVAEIAGVATLPVRPPPRARRRAHRHPGPRTARRRHRPGLPLRRQRGDRPGLPAGRLPPHRHRLHRRTRRPHRLTCPASGVRSVGATGRRRRRRWRAVGR